MFKIGDFSKLSNVSIRMLRHYEKLGLIKPDQVDEFSGFRFYSTDQIKEVNRIQRLKALGFSLAVIKEIITADSTDDISKYLEIRQQELQEELERITAQSHMLDSVKEIIAEDKIMMNYNVTLKELPKRYVMSLRGILPTFHDEELLWNRLYQEVPRQKIKFPADSLSMAIYHDREYKENDVDIEVQSVINGQVGDHTDTDNARFCLAPAKLTAAVTFHGSYEQMPLVTMALAKWIEDNNYIICGPMLNIFHISPAQDPNCNNWITESCIEIRKRASY